MNNLTRQLIVSLALLPYIQQKFKDDFHTQTCRKYHSSQATHHILQNALAHIVISPNRQNLHTESNPNPNSDICTKQPAIDSSWAIDGSESDQPVTDPDNSTVAKDSAMVQNLLKTHSDSSIEELEPALENCGLSLTEDLVLQVLKRHRSDWKPAFLFFNWVSKRGGGGENGSYTPGTAAHNELLDILGRMKRFEQLEQVLDEMSKRKNSVNERTYAILLNRYAAAHKIEEAIQIFYKRIEFGLELDLIAFQTLLLSLCRYKHVEAAEFLFLSKKNEFPPDIKTRNIILNGWCVLGSLREAKRFWNDIISSRCRPDLFTYGIFINSLTKAGKLGTAVKLFRAMWEKGCTPDVAICNCIIDGLCFKKRIPEALEIFGEMNEKGCLPDVATYNSLIKHLCNIRRLEKVYELLEEMEQKKGCCTPNARTYNYLLKSMKKPEEVPGILERMEKNGCKITGDTYNLILKLFMDWNHPQGVEYIWAEMEKNGLGPDQRSYTIKVHGLHGYGRIEEALKYFNEMISKGMIPEPRTKLLVKSINMKLKERDERGEEAMNPTSTKDSSLSSDSAKQEKKKKRVG
ncbi:Pentatricopeptide repeat [Macleaya cordata]|uniref:Pentatricopeptide repeat n=1 Tax=Macleaya cordata TaxID=56857 RepID=A0A200QM34_MACCD|nr:Pentatricopeptide repeat [Macleaya cordata]